MPKYWQRSASYVLNAPLERISLATPQMLGVPARTSSAVAAAATCERYQVEKKKNLLDTEHKNSNHIWYIKPTHL